MMLITILLVIIAFAVAPDFMVGMLMLAFWLGVIALIGGLLIFGLAMLSV